MWGTTPKAAVWIALLLCTLVCACTGGNNTASPIEAKTTKAAVVERAIVPTRQLYAFPETSALMARPCLPEPAPPFVADTSDYRIGPGDVLAFQILDEPTLNRQLVVRYDGYISLPMIEDVAVGGLSRAEAEARVREAYTKVFRNPRLALTVDEVLSRSYFVLGEVEEPSEYAYKRPLSLLAAITIAGGIRTESNGGTANTIGAQGQLTKAFIIRHVDGQRVVLEYDLKGLRNPGEHPSDVPVLPGDFVYVPEGVNLVYVLGEVKVPGVYPLLEQMTVLQLLSRAGGPVEARARMRQAVLLRQTDPTHTEALLIDMRKALKTGFSPVLCPGDILYVPRGDLVRLYENLIRFTNLTETVSPILDLYMQAYDTWYTKRRFEELFEDDDAFGYGYGSSINSLLQTIRDFGLDIGK